MKARDLAQGKWPGILAQLGIDSRVLNGRHHPCPANGEGEDRFRFADRNGSGNYFCQCSDGRKGGIDLVMCCKGIGFAEACREVERVVGVVPVARTETKRDPRPALNRIREMLKPVSFTVSRYLRERGLKPAPALRSARLAYWDGGNRLGVFESMVALISGPDGKPQSYHITYLEGAGKARVPSPRKVMTPVETITGGAIRLYPHAPAMGVAEGIETAIAAHMLTGLPVWAAVSAHGIETFVPPDDVRHLTIFSDNDANFAGQAAAYALARRMQKAGVMCAVQVPEAGDWNDELRRAAS